MPGKRYDRQFKLATARLVLAGEIPVLALAKELDVPANTLRRWALEYEIDGETSFPGSGSARINKDYEIAKLLRENEELRKENELLKKFRAFLKQPQR